MVECNVLVMDDQKATGEAIFRQVLGNLPRHGQVFTTISDWNVHLQDSTERIDIAILDLKLDKTWDRDMKHPHRQQWIERAKVAWNNDTGALKSMEPDHVGIAQLFAGFMPYFSLNALQQEHPLRLPPIVILYTGNNQLREVLWPFTEELSIAGRPFIIVEKDPVSKDRLTGSEIRRFQDIMMLAERERYSTAHHRGYALRPLMDLLNRLRVTDYLEAQAATDLLAEIETMAATDCGSDGPKERICFGHLFPVHINALRNELREHIAKCGESSLACGQLQCLASSFASVVGDGHWPTVIHNMIGTNTGRHYDVLHNRVQLRGAAGDVGDLYKNAAAEFARDIADALPNMLGETMLKDLAQRTVAWDKDTGKLACASIGFKAFHWLSTSSSEWSDHLESLWCNECADPWKADWRDHANICCKIAETLRSTWPCVSIACMAQPFSKTIMYLNVPLLEKVIVAHAAEALSNKVGATNLWLRTTNVDPNGWGWSLDLIDDGPGFARENTGHDNQSVQTAMDMLRNEVAMAGKTFQSTRQELAGWAELEVYTRIHDGSIVQVNVNSLSISGSAKEWPQQDDDHSSSIPWASVGTIIRFNFSMMP